MRNVGPALHKFGTLFGMAYTFIDQKIARGHMPFTLADPVADHDKLVPAHEATKIDYPKPDGVLSFDKLSSVFLSNTNHEEDQPCHLTLEDAELPIRDNLPLYDEPAQRYCRPASTKWSRRTASHDSRSTPRTACTARRATSRIRHRTSTGLRRKARAGRTTGICRCDEQVAFLS